MLLWDGDRIYNYITHGATQDRDRDKKGHISPPFVSVTYTREMGDGDDDAKTQ